MVPCGQTFTGEETVCEPRPLEKPVNSVRATGGGMNGIADEGVSKPTCAWVAGESLEHVWSDPFNWGGEGTSTDFRSLQHGGSPEEVDGCATGGILGFHRAGGGILIAKKQPYPETFNKKSAIKALVALEAFPLYCTQVCVIWLPLLSKFSP
jgi:hypothetical protein